MESEIRSLSLNPDIHSEPLPRIENLHGAIGIDFDFNDETIYFSQVHAKKLNKFKKGSTTIEDIAEHYNITGMTNSISIEHYNITGMTNSIAIKASPSGIIGAESRCIIFVCYFFSKV